MINSRELKHLNPLFCQKVIQWQGLCKGAGLDVLVISTYRDNEFQNTLYAKGRSEAGRIVTNNKGGQSKHNKTQNGEPASEAADFCILKNGKADWSDIASYTKAGKLAEKIGLTWAGSWTGKLKEYGHIETPTHF